MDDTSLLRLSGSRRSVGVGPFFYGALLRKWYKARREVRMGEL